MGTYQNFRHIISHKQWDREAPSWTRFKDPSGYKRFSSMIMWTTVRRAEQQELLHSWGWAPTATSLDTPNSKHSKVKSSKAKACSVREVARLASLELLWYSLAWVS